MFEAMMGQIDADVVEKVFAVQVARQEDVEMMQERRRARQPSQLVMSGGAAAGPASRPAAARREGAKVGRNDPCPCGSGKKYKKCHGA
jgi:preprotein translocase subunit SecA